MNITPHQHYAAAALSGILSTLHRAPDMERQKRWAELAHQCAAAMVAAEPAQTAKHPIAEFSPAVLQNAIEGLEMVRAVCNPHHDKKLDAALFILREFQK